MKTFKVIFSNYWERNRVEVWLKAKSKDDAYNSLYSQWKEMSNTIHSIKEVKGN